LQWKARTGALRGTDLQRKARLCATKNEIIHQINFSFNKSKDDLSITLKNFKKLRAE
jgi:hypothetical protein